jgi:hypothetical protein
VAVELRVMWLVRPVIRGSDVRVRQHAERRRMTIRSSDSPSVNGRRGQRRARERVEAPEPVLLRHVLRDTSSSRTGCGEIDGAGAKR